MTRETLNKSYRICQKQKTVLVWRNSDGKDEAYLRKQDSTEQLENLQINNNLKNNTESQL